MVKPLPNNETAQAEAFEVLHESFGRFGEILEHQWVRGGKGAAFDPAIDLRLRFQVTKGQASGTTWWIHALIKNVVYPKQATEAIWALKQSVAKSVNHEPVYPILIAPFISDSVAKRCEQEQIGYLDLAGNCEIEFGGIWIHRQGLPRKYKEVRPQKSLFSPKASRVLRVLLSGPLRPHLVHELASKAEVSLGLVSKVRRVLLDEEVAIDTKEGIEIKRPQAVLRDWLLEDDFAARTDIREYSTLTDGESLAELLVVSCSENQTASSLGPLFTLNFGAWLRAPHNVPTTVSVYLEQFPSEGLLDTLQARPVGRGAGNLRVIVPKDFKALTIDQQACGDFQVVSDLQLFLDLHEGEPNGKEQARVLRKLEDFNGGWNE